MDNCKNIRYYLGIDGGGTKTEFAIASKDGKDVKTLVLGASNPNDVGFEKTLRVLTEGIKSLCGDIPLCEISVYAGLAGCSSYENLPRIKKFLESFGFARIDNHNDAQNAVAAALKDGDGIAVIMGTGSIAYVKKGSELHRIGGYGYLFGDLGSGFAIGRDTVLSALSYEDGSGSETVLYEMVKEKCGGETVLSKIDHFYKEGKKEIARYAPLAFEGFLIGDKVSRDIIISNLSAVANMIKAGAKYFDSGCVKAVLLGGLTKSADVIIPILSDMLGQYGIRCDISVCQKPPVYGALRLAGYTE